jgi:dTDP-4-dehydrorhamnose reductase
MRFWVTGRDGLLGGAMTAAVKTGREVDIATVTDPPRFDAVINCAAATDVAWCEDHETEAAHANAAGPENLARLARRREAISVHVSTDYVFDGAKRDPYLEDDETNPLNAYGRTKRDGEQRFLAAGGDYVVRTSWLFGGKTCFVTRMRALDHHVKVVDDQYGRPTYVHDLAAFLVELVHRRPERGVYHYANAEATSWYELARAAGAPVSPIATPSTGVRRPPYSVLSTAKIDRTLGIRPRGWRDAL